MAEVRRPVMDGLVADRMEITEQEVSRRKQFLEFRQDDADALRTLGDVARRYADPVIEDLYQHSLTFDETREFFRDPRVLERVNSCRRSTSCV